MKLMIGLGNPGAEYAGHRHNIGFMAIDLIAQRFHAAPFKSKFHGLITETTIEREKCLLLKPSTYMNRSGISVGEVCAFYKIPPADCLVFHDELDLPFAEARAKIGGSHAGHNGLKDIDRAIGPDYWRVRLGIGHPGSRERVTGYVLSNFNKEEQSALPDFLDRCLTPLEKFAQQGGDSYRQALGMSLVKKP